MNNEIESSAGVSLRRQIKAVPAGDIGTQCLNGFRHNALTLATRLGASGHAIGRVLQARSLVRILQPILKPDRAS
ncbi:hypothetical protein [Chitinolyticbacter albus]|uniref:hypothetical protein n=1 Tax=Chitinolyticbacter albus TaxID=2961951 RepID=UPI00210A8507|nr:hypothetical protein [Chitinolyticbacter albus]